MCRDEQLCACSFELSRKDQAHQMSIAHSDAAHDLGGAQTRSPLQHFRELARAQPHWHTTSDELHAPVAVFSRERVLKCLAWQLLLGEPIAREAMQSNHVLGPELAQLRVQKFAIQRVISEPAMLAIQR